MSDIATSIKALIITIRNVLQEGDASNQKGKVKILKPMPYIGMRDAWKLENFVFDMDQYFQAISTKQFKKESIASIIGESSSNN